MKFNISYLGPEWLFHLRRDFILVLKYSLEGLGHQANLAGPSLDSSAVNLVIGAYFLKPDQIQMIAKSGYKYININTEVIADNMLNHNPDKVDFMGAYLPMMRASLARWDVIEDNIPEYIKYDSPAKFLRWGYHPAMQDIDHRTNKDLDYYFFGMISPRRKAILVKLETAGLKGIADHSCPYFLRNDRIARSKVNLNLIQDEKYSHVNSFRICYLANNNCHILSELENDPAGYLKYAEIIDPDNIVEHITQSLKNDAWKEKGIAASKAFQEFDMNSIMESILDLTFSKN
jgi:hypothetical protein